MKKLSFFVSAFALCASTSYAAINCGTLPSCASLGYTDTVSQCPKSSTGAEMVVKCPFDTTQGKCIREAAVGQIAYFSKAPNSASGWLKCDGTTFTKTKYPELYALIGQQFCNAYNAEPAEPMSADCLNIPVYFCVFTVRRIHLTVKSVIRIWQPRKKKVCLIFRDLSVVWDNSLATLPIAFLVLFIA